MATYRIKTPDGISYNVTAPDDATQDQVLAYAQQRHADAAQPEQSAQPAEPSLLDRGLSLNREAGQAIANAGAGALKGASQIGATILSPLDYIAQKAGISNSFIGRNDRREAVTQGLQDAGADPNSLAFKTGEIGAEIAGTAGLPGAIGGQVARIAPRLGTAITSGGFSTGAPAAKALSLAGARNAAIRVGGGAASGAAMAGAINPDQAGTGAVIGGAIPVAGKLAGEAGKAIGKSFTASHDVAQLAQKAKSLGIDIPADRLANSKMLDATAASLNYVPFSGRIATETKMNNQIKTALSKTFGENTPHLSKDLIAKTQTKLGKGFDDFLTKNKIKVDQQLFTDLQGNLAKAKNELSADNYRIVENQVKDLWSKIDNGLIDGQAAYNVKKTLDRLGRGSGNEAFHAKQVRDSLMNGVLRSVPPDEAAAFTALKRKYANLKTVEKLAGNTAEGDISMARLGNLDSKNPEVSDIAKIAATFAKGRESPHGAMQRVTIGGGVTALGGGLAAGVAAPVAAGLTGGRLANMALNSNTVKKMILAQPKGGNRLADLLSNPAVRALPIAAQSR